MLLLAIIFYKYSFLFHLLSTLDGFWNNITAKEIAVVMQPHIEGKHGDISRSISRANFRRGENSLSVLNKNTSASALLDKCLENAAKAACIPVSRMKKMSPGIARRNIVDDITILVIFFNEGNTTTPDTQSFGNHK